MHRRRQRLCRIRAADDEALGLGRAFDGAAENQRLDLIVEQAPGLLARARVARRHLAQNHDHGIGPRVGEGELQQSVEHVEAAFAGIVGRHVGRDIDHVARVKLGGVGGETDARAMLAQKIVEARLDHRQLPGVEARHQRRIAIDRARGEALAGGCDRRAEPEVSHPHIADDGRAHAALHFIASADKRPSTR